eukprot:14298087-Alexandrium_andersonii.AAC.1
MHQARPPGFRGPGPGHSRAAWPLALGCCIRLVSREAERRWLGGPAGPRASWERARGSRGPKNPQGRRSAA